MTANEPIYLDYAAATPVDERVLEAMAPYHARCFANPSASYAPARKVRADVEDARARIAHLMGAKPANVIFTAGATEANNLALTAAAPDAHVIASAIEHASVRACVEARALGTLLPVDGEGLVDPECCAPRFAPTPSWSALPTPTAEIGTIQPLREIAGVIGRRACPSSGDGGGAPHLPAYGRLTGGRAQVAQTSPRSRRPRHRVRGQAIRSQTGRHALGAQRHRGSIRSCAVAARRGGLRSGTENVPGIMGFVRAFEIACELRDAEARRLRELRDWLQGQLSTAFEDVIVAGPARNAARLDNLLHVSFPGLARPSSGHPARPARRLRWYGVGMRREQDDGVTRARGHWRQSGGRRGQPRITLGRDTTREQVERAARVIIEVVRAERQRVGMA